MASEIKLTEVFTKEHFRRIEGTFGNHFHLGLETTKVNGTQVRRICSPDCHPEFCRIVRGSITGAKRCRQDRMRSMRIAIETGQPYISFCHAGIVLVCVPIMDRDIPLGGLFFGKCLWEPVSKTTEEDILKRLNGLRLNKYRLINVAGKLPIIPGRRIHEAAEFLFVLLYEVTKLDPRVIKWHRQRTQQQSEISDFIQKSKKTATELRYPYESERELIGKVKIGDRTGAREILNSLLGAIIFHDPGDLNILKARLFELLSILSRAAVEGGVDINLLLEKNRDYINKVMEIDTQENLCAWVSSALDDFIESVCTAQDSKKITQIRPAIEYIEAYYDSSITVPDIAKESSLSVSRLVHLFKEQMGITIIDYLTGVRIGHAKRLLLATDKTCTRICFDVGYNNQSYFTRTFKEVVGMTPMQFRQSNRREKPIKTTRDRRRRW